jgi:hypothetical protein
MSPHHCCRSFRYRFHNIGLYCHYAGIGVGYGIAGIALNFCFYFYNGSDNVCANAPSLVFLAWGFKIFYAVATDRFRPFGSRRRVYMTWGWAGAVGCTVVLAIIGDTCTVETWLGLSIATQAFMMLADVPADGYSVELGQLEAENERGVILSTGQFIRFLATMFAGVIQATMVNGVSTNASDCEISALNCWSWGLTVGQYYRVLAVIFAVLALPIFFMREVSSDHIPLHSFAQHGHALWETLQNPTTLYLLVFVSANGALSQLTPITYNYVQYTLVNLTNLQGGVQVVVTYLAVAVGVKIFQVFFLNRNWRTTLYLSVGLTQVMGLAWILVYWNVAGLLDPWFTIFITVNQALAAGVSQVLFSMAVIELAQPGQEAITYELIVSVANAALTVTVVLATQLLTPFDSVTCRAGGADDDGTCASNQVNVESIDAYNDSDGPARFTRYSLVCLGIGLVSLVAFTPFLPRTKVTTYQGRWSICVRAQCTVLPVFHRISPLAHFYPQAECAAWKTHGENGEFYFSRTMTGVLSSGIAFLLVGYVTLASVAILNPKTACMSAFGGGGC